MWKKKKKKRTPQDKGRQPGCMYTWHPSWLCNMRPPNQTSCLCITIYGRQRSRKKCIKKICHLAFRTQFFGYEPNWASVSMNKVASWKEKPRCPFLCENPATHYDFCCFKFVMVCFRVQNVACLGVFSTWAWDMCVLLLLNEVICRCYIHLVDGVVEFSYVLTDFLPAGPVHLWWMDVEISSYNNRFISFTQRKRCLFWLVLAWYILFVLISFSMVYFF